jgi:hypothetical protein
MSNWADSPILDNSYWFKDASNGRVTCVTIIEHYGQNVAIGENIYAPVEELSGQWVLIPKPLEE